VTAGTSEITARRGELGSVDVSSLLVEIYDRIPPVAHAAVSGVDPATLTEVPAPGTNSIAWLVWHLARVEDHHVAELLDDDQLWVTGDWAPRFGLGPDPDNTGYGHRPPDVASVRPDSADALVGYLDAVHARTLAMLDGLGPGDLDRVVDHRWDPPVTLGVRLVSVADDALQHAGQAAYVRGLLGA
jgi:hypothetical protein